ncbi:hypothetical protein P3T24_001659 [Paraburkholderia sp. GAS33]|jgi:hypothetical protein|uniref:hypothetical protein n=1 Tax=Paraburkholderia sp. GAS33 TaxID=3035130 RepID=UPI003D21E9BA
MKKTWLNAPRVARLALVLSAAIGASGAWGADVPGVAFVYLGNPGEKNRITREHFPFLPKFSHSRV